MNPAKLHSSLAATVPKDLSAQDIGSTPIPIIIKFRKGPVARGESQALSDAPAGTVFRLLSARASVASPAFIAALTDDPAVEMIWPDLPVHTWLDDAALIIEAPRVWTSGFTGVGVRIAILDTGIDANHPDFEGRITAYRDLVEGPEDEDIPVSPKDPNGHGTHVAGIAAGSGAASDGRWRGIAPDAQLIVGRVLDAFGSGRTSTVMAGIEWAIDRGARIVNISLGGPPYPSDGTDALSTLCSAAVDAGVIICAAAGNLGPAGHTIGSPGAAESVITVGASESEAGLAWDRVALFSSRGPTGRGLIKPDVVFPGVGIVSARADGTSLGTAVGDRYTALRGTSQATPMAAGAAALLLQSNPRLSPSDVKSRITRGAARLADEEPMAQGAGRGNVFNAFVGASGSPIVVTPGAPGSPSPVPPEGSERAGCVPGALAALAGVGAGAGPGTGSGVKERGKGRAGGRGKA